MVPRVVLEGVRWQTYQMLVHDLSERRIRLSYDRGKLEIMAPLFNHERFKRHLGRFIEILADEYNRPFVSGGSTTFQREDLERGLEPDDCFYFGNAPRVRDRLQIDLSSDPPPDLAIEVDITRSSFGRMGIYAALGVPEIWRYDGTRLSVHVLQVDGAYVTAPRSLTFPEVALEQVEGFLGQVAQQDDLSLQRAFRAWVRTLLTPPAP
jgi:Uma2 family endonuclease